MTTDPDAEPDKFRVEFEPDPAVDYGWVLKHAERVADHDFAVYRRLDDKAAAVLGYVGGGAGIFTLGSLAAVASDKVDAVVAAFALPSVIAAALSVGFAARGRWSVDTPGPTSIGGAIKYAHYFGGRAEAAFLGQWNQASADMKPVLAGKARWVNLATAAFAAAIVLLTLPLVAGIVVRTRATPSPKPLEVRLVAPAVPPAAP